MLTFFLNTLLKLSNFSFKKPTNNLYIEDLYKESLSKANTLGHTLNKPKPFKYFKYAGATLCKKCGKKIYYEYPNKIAGDALRVKCPYVSGIPTKIDW